MKKCKGCDRELPLDSFQSHIRNRDGKQTQCKECMNTKCRDWWARVGKDRYAGKRRGNQYGLTLSQVESLEKSAGGKCQCCSERTKKLLIDHDHITGKVRGLVCNSCNVGLAYIDKVGFWEKAHRYINGD